MLIQKPLFVRAAMGFVLVVLVLTVGSSAGAGSIEKDRGRNLPTKAPLAKVGAGGGFHMVVQLDPVSLALTQTEAELPEYHDSYSFSPDESQVAFGISNSFPGGRAGIRIVEARDVSVAGDIKSDAFAAGLAWLEPERLVALIGDSSTCTTPECNIVDNDYSTVVVVDPATGDTLERGRVPHSCGTSEMRGRALLSISERRLSIVEAGGRVETLTLPRSFAECGEIATSLSDEDAFVIADDGRTIAQIELASSRLSVHDLPAGSSAVDQVIGLASDRLVLAQRTGGVKLFDLRAKKARMLDASADRVRVSGRSLLVYGTKKVGVRAYRANGRRTFAVLKGEKVSDLGIAGRFGYAISKSGVAVIDLRVGKVVSRSPVRFRGDLLTEPSAP